MRSFDASMAPAVRYTTLSEHDRPAAASSTRAAGCPALAAGSRIDPGRWKLFGEAAVFQADIDYDGQLQNGRPYRSETGTRMAEAQLGLRYRILDATDIVAALGVDSWRRHIGGSGQAIGLQEHARSGRVLIGVEHAWQLDSGKLSAGASPVHAAPERLRIGISGLLDDVSIRTRAANGAALSAWRGIEAGFHRPVRHHAGAA